ncbi:uncharacterized protein LOC136717829 isoform X1 [Amia ocellicauda]|uniref:uncharacterized protein LOC136717829 isoform X1 n=1 Tax=Amia ocellicauda TaxID=2972642 RepID=UPI003464B55F
MSRTAAHIHCLLAVLLTCTLPDSSSDPCALQVLGRRNYLKVPEGGSVSLSCRVAHCGEGRWTGGWGRNDLGDFSPLNLTDTVQLTEVPTAANETELRLTFLRLNQSDSGGYQCRVKGTGTGTFTLGHLTNLTVTAITGRSRTGIGMLPWLCPTLAFSLTLLLVLCLSLCSRWTYSAPCYSGVPAEGPSAPAQPELVYAAVSIRHSSHPLTDQPVSQSEPTVYSSVRFKKSSQGSCVELG